MKKSKRKRPFRQTSLHPHEHFRMVLEAIRTDPRLMRHLARKASSAQKDNRKGAFLLNFPIMNPGMPPRIYSTISQFREYGNREMIRWTPAAEILACEINGYNPDEHDPLVIRMAIEDDRRIIREEMNRRDGFLFTYQWHYRLLGAPAHLGPCLNWEFISFDEITHFEHRSPLLEKSSVPFVDMNIREDSCANCGKTSVWCSKKDLKPGIVMNDEMRALLSAQRMQQCGKCRKVLYCSKKCQKKHWKKHKKECTAAKD